MPYCGALRARRLGRRLLALATILAVTPTAFSQMTPTAAVRGDGMQQGRALMADALAHRAQQQGRDAAIPVRMATHQALVLLKQAQALAPDNPDILRMLADAARNAGDTDTLRDALKNLVRVDPGDLVAQVAFLDAVAQGKTIEQQLGIYQAAENSNSLNLQVRSAAATRAGRLLLQRGESAAAEAAFAHALQLNDVNVDALQEICRAAVAQGAAPEEQIRLFTRLLQANPYQPDALVAASRLLGQANDHQAAAEWLSAALEQFEQAGQPISPDLLQELVVHLACMNASAEANQGAHQLSKLPGAPADVALLAYTIAAPGMMVPPNPATIDAARLANVKQRAADLAAQGDNNAAALSDALWIELFYLPLPAPAGANTEPADPIATQLEHLRDLVGPQDPLYLRLFGWRLLRTEKLDAAAKVLAPLAAQDPYAELGLAKIAAGQQDLTSAAAHLQTIWNHYPRGLLAVHTAALARNLNITLKPTDEQLAMQGLAGRYPRHLLLAHRSPGQIVEVTSRVEQPVYDLGQPVYAQVTFNNKTDHALSVGSNGAIKVAMVIGGSLRGLKSTPLGIFGAADAPRVFRLDRRSSFTIRIRIDQGQLWDMLYYNPTRLINANAYIFTAPRYGKDSVDPGLGGIKISSAAQFDRSGMAISGADGIKQIASDLPRQPLDQQMLGAAVLENVLAGLPSDAKMADAEDNARQVYQQYVERKAAAEIAAQAADAADTAHQQAAASQPASRPGEPALPGPLLPQTPAPRAAVPVPPNLVDPETIATERDNMRDLRNTVTQALLNRLQQGDPLIAAWMLQFRPAEGLPKDLDTALNLQATAHSPVVRMSYDQSLASSAEHDLEQQKHVIDTLSTLAEKEKDPDVKQFALLLVEELKLPPATAPAQTQTAQSQPAQTNPASTNPAPREPTQTAPSPTPPAQPAQTEPKTP